MVALQAPMDASTIVAFKLVRRTGGMSYGDEKDKRL